MACRFAVFVFAAIAWSPVSQAQPILGGPPSDYAPIVLRVACGGVFSSACAKVVPRLAAQTVHAGVVLKPAAGGIPFDSASAVCDGQAAAAIVQRDVIALIAHQPTCLNRFDFVGQPLYPFYAFLIARADAPFRSLDELAASKRRRLIMAGAEGTGGQITLGFMLRSNPVWQRAITVMMGDPDVGLQKVADGTIDGFFAMEPLDSETIDRVRRRLDARGKPLFAFTDIRPGPELFRDRRRRRALPVPADRARFRRRPAGHDGVAGCRDAARPRFSRRPCARRTAGGGRSGRGHRRG